MLGQKYILSALYFQIGFARIQAFTSHIHFEGQRFYFGQSFDWVQQDIFEVIFLNICSTKEGRPERGNFKQPQQCFESSQVLRIMTDQQAGSLPLYCGIVPPSYAFENLSTKEKKAWGGGRKGFNQKRWGSVFQSKYSLLFFLSKI